MGIIWLSSLTLIILDGHVISGPNIEVIILWHHLAGYYSNQFLARALHVLEMTFLLFLAVIFLLY